MNPIEPAQCLEQLARLLDEEVATLTQLETQLQREHAMLIENDVDGLEAAGNERQACVSQLLRIEDEWRGLCRLFGKPGDLKGVETLLTGCDPSGALLPALRDCADRAARCRDQNVRNGALVNARLQRVSNLLGMLDTNAGSSRTYGRQGASAAPSPRAGRSFNASA
jgi:flagellar biosynthesis/type III secretory pathway chaperone